MGFIRQNANALGAFGQALTGIGAQEKQGALAGGDYMNQAYGLQGQLSNNVQNERNALRDKQYNMLSDAPNLTADINRRNRQDAFLKAIIGKNPRLKGMEALIPNAAGRAPEYGEDALNQSAAQSLYMTPEMFSEIWGQKTGNLFNTPETQQYGDAAMRLGNDNVAKQSSYFDNWLQNQTETAQNQQKTLADQSHDVSSKNMTEKLGIITGLLGGAAKFGTQAATGGGGGLGGILKMLGLGG